MLRITLIILFISSLTLKSQNQIDTLVLNPNEILSIQIKKVNPKNAHLQRELKLKENQHLEFTQRWNNSHRDSSEKLKPQYFVFVSLKSKKIKYFAIADNQIDNGNGEVRTSSGNKEYFDNLWKSLCE